MKAFHFRLAQLQRLGKAEEEAQKRMLRERLEVLEQAEQALQAANQQVRHWSAQVQQMESHGLLAANLQDYRRWLPHLEQLAAECAEDRQQADESAEQQRESFRQARQKSKVLANLRDREHQEHRWQEQLAAQQEQDELAVMAWPRRDQA